MASIQGDDSGLGFGVKGTSSSGDGVSGHSGTGDGVSGRSSGTGAGVIGQSHAGSGVSGIGKVGTGVLGQSAEADGVVGKSSLKSGVKGETDTGFGILGLAAEDAGTAVQGEHQTDGVGVYGLSHGGNGVEGFTENYEDGATGSGVFGRATPQGYGVYGYGQAEATGVFGFSETGIGVWGQVRSDVESAVYGINEVGIGVKGVSQGEGNQPFEEGKTPAIGVQGKGQIGVQGLGRRSGDEQNGLGVHGQSGNNTGVFGESESHHGIEGRTYGDFGAGVQGEGPRTGVAGISTAGHGGNGVVGRATGGLSAGVIGEATGDGPNYGVKGQGYVGVYGESRAPAADPNIGPSAGVYGQGDNLTPGVVGRGKSKAAGVGGVSESGAGVYAYSFDGNSLFARSPHPSNVGGYGFAGSFQGAVNVSGPLHKSGGGFRIDHPLDPAHKYLNHSFVESPEMKNVYDGVIELGDDGTATVTLPAWFEALNGDFRYQLTPLGAPAPELHIHTEIADRQFVIAGGEPGLRVSWQVTGIRRDPWAKANQVEPEMEKPEVEQGFYRHPEVYDLPPEQGIELVKHRDLIDLTEAVNNADNP